MEHSNHIYVGIDVSKMRNAIAVADGAPNSEVRFLGEVDASEESMRRVVKRVAAKSKRAHHDVIGTVQYVIRKAEGRLPLEGIANAKSRRRSQGRQASVDARSVAANR